MLILTRRTGESIRIGDDVEIVVKEVGRNHVRLGINAPRNIKVRRLEVMDGKEKTEKPDEPETENR